MSKVTPFAVCIGLLTAAPVLAQDAGALDRFERQLEQIQRDTRLKVDTTVPADQRVVADYGGYLTLNFLAIDDDQGTTHILRQYDMNVYGRLNLDNVHEFFLRVRTSYRDFNTGDDFDGLGDDWVEPTLDRAHYRFDLKRYMAAYQGEMTPYDFTLQGGRQLVHWANGLTLSQEIDGAVFDLGYEQWAMQIVLGRTRDSTTDFDSSRPSFADETRRGFYGALLSYQLTAQHKPFVYGLVQVDNNEAETLNSTVGGVATTTNFDYNSWYFGAGSRGNLSDNILYGVEFVYQGGSTLSSSFDITGGVVTALTQTEDDISAMAFDVVIDYLMNDPNRSRLTFEVIMASGDDDRIHSNNTFGGNAPNTTDRGFNGFGLLNTGLAFAPSVSNLIMMRMGGSTFPSPTSSVFGKLQVGTNLFVFAKLNPDAPIDEDTKDDRYLGFEADFYANWQITSDVSFAMRYGFFVPGDAIGGAITPNDGNARHFFYSGLTLGF